MSDNVIDNVDGAIEALLPVISVLIMALAVAPLLNVELIIWNPTIDYSCGGGRHKCPLPGTDGSQVIHFHVFDAHDTVDKI